MTRSGQASNVEIVREFIYPTEYEPPELPNSVGSSFGGDATPVTPATPTAFEKKEVGITLEVLPVADANKRYVDVTLNPSFTDFDGFVNYGSPINSTTQDAFGNPVTAKVTENAILMPVFSAQKAEHPTDGGGWLDHRHRRIDGGKHPKRGRQGPGLRRYSARGAPVSIHGQKAGIHRHRFPRPRRTP